MTARLAKNSAPTANHRRGRSHATIPIAAQTAPIGSTAALEPVKCTVGSQWNIDLAANYKINEHASVYLNILNAFDIDPNFDPSAAYSIFQYNPAWGQAGIVGRTFRVGVKLDL